jgi:hypothetical protein
MDIQRSGLVDLNTFTHREIAGLLHRYHFKVIGLMGLISSLISHRRIITFQPNAVLWKSLPCLWGNWILPFEVSGRSTGLVTVKSSSFEKSRLLFINSSLTPLYLDARIT